MPSDKTTINTSFPTVQPKLIRKLHICKTILPYHHHVQLILWVHWLNIALLQIHLESFPLKSLLENSSGEAGIKWLQLMFLTEISKLLWAHGRAKVAVGTLLVCRIFCPFHNSLLFLSSIECRICKSHGYQYSAFYSWFWLPLSLLA